MPETLTRPWDIDRLRAMALEGRLIQNAWTRRGEGDRELCCLLSALVPGLESMEECPSELMPHWLARLFIDLYDGLLRYEVARCGLLFAGAVSETAAWSALPGALERWRAALAAFAHWALGRLDVYEGVDGHELADQIRSIPRLMSSPDSYSRVTEKLVEIESESRFEGGADPLTAMANFLIYLGALHSIGYALADREDMDEFDDSVITALNLAAAHADEVRFARPDRPLPEPGGKCIAAECFEKLCDFIRAA
jgi:hypothetical protein